MKMSAPPATPRWRPAAYSHAPSGLRERYERAALAFKGVRSITEGSGTGVGPGLRFGGGWRKGRLAEISRKSRIHASAVSTGKACGSLGRVGTVVRFGTSALP
jgi:hypothetical protein